MKRRNLLLCLALSLALLLSAACARAAEIRPLPVDPAEIDLNNGEFCLTVKDGDKAEREGWFTAELFVEEHFDAEQIKALAPGDTVVVDGRTWTVKEVVIHGDEDDGDEDYVEEEAEDAEAYAHADEEAGGAGNYLSYEIYTEEEFFGYIAFWPMGGIYTSVVNDWTPLIPVGEVKVTLPLADGFRYVTYEGGEETDPAGAEEFLRKIAEDGDRFIAYNTDCVFENGMLTQVTHSDYPGGPDGDYGD